MDDMEAVELENYDGILFGTYTWGDGDLPYELEDFYDDMDISIYRAYRPPALDPAIPPTRNTEQL